MRRNLLVLAILFSSFLGFADIPDGYYDDAEGLNGEQLKTALYHIIKGHNSQSYNSIWTHFQSTDPKPNGKVWDMYSDVPGGTPPYEYEFGEDQCGNYSGEGSCYNREHSFPKSWFNDASPMVTEIFHIVPTDGYVNSKRSNYPFGETNDPDWTSENGSKVGGNSTPGYSGTIFEPIDEYKGDFARIYFYMATRYENIIANWENNSSNADAALDGTSFPVYEEWYLNMILEWHNNDPVSQKEIDRNNAIYDVQNNRNPFVDHPEWVATVWGGAQAPAITQVNYQPEFPDADEEVTVTAHISDEGNVVSAQLKWGFTNSNLNNSINMTGSPTYSGTIPAQAAGQMVYFRIVATDDESNTSMSAIYNYQVNQVAGTIALPFLEDFNDETLGVFYQVSVEGAEQYWHNNEYEDDYYAKMSNYDGDENIANEDWMITPSIDLNAYDGEILSFISSMKDYSDNNTHIYLKYSLNYEGSGDPNEADWTDISAMATWSPGEYEWIASGDIDLSSINGNSVHIAIEYTAQAGSGKTWQIDDFDIRLETASNTPPVISNITYEPSNPESDEEVEVEAQIVDNDGTVQSAALFWGLQSGNLANVIDMNASGNIYDATIPGQEESTVVFFQIHAFDNEGEESVSAEYQYSVQSATGNLALPFMENFENEDLGVFNQYSVTGEEQFWHNDDFDDNMYAKMSNYNSSENIENEDWLISLPINFDAYSDEVLVFASAMKDYSDDNTFIYLKISNNYDGQSDPNQATWTNLTAQANWSSGDYEWEGSGEIDLSAITGNEVYLAFQYVSESESGKTWEIDNVSITLNGSSNEPPVITDVNHLPINPTDIDYVTVSALVEDDNDVSNVELQYGFSMGQLNQSIIMSPDASVYEGEIPSMEASTDVYYRIKATDNDAAVSYSNIQHYTVDISDALAENDAFNWTLFPNPAKDVLKIKRSQQEPTNLYIFGIDGKLYGQQEMNTNETNIDVSALPSGVFIIRMISESQSFQKRFIISR